MKSPDSPTQQFLVSICLLLLLGVTWLIYYPGLAGDFLFDDWSNLRLLGAYGKIDNQESLILYLLSGFSGPTGRPISTLSFLIDANNWPADPGAFKRTNLLLHLLNGVVLFALVRKLTQALGQYRTAAWVALLSTALWLLHPFFVSTTLYIVQRMTQLSTLFALAGLWLYLTVRLKYPPVASFPLMTGTATAIGLFGLLAVFSKENGVLLPLLVITLEATVLKVHGLRKGQKATPGFRRWRLLLLGLPVALLVGYLALQLKPLFEGSTGIRDYTPAERLLTQGRILWDYVFHIVLPRPYTGGLFNDDILLSTSLLHPWNTFIAWLSWLLVFTWAVMNRIRHPAAALAILFFLAGHLLESSFIQLELYFEHRNYLPATLLGFPIALRLLNRKMRKPVQYFLALGVVLVLVILTSMRASLWGQPFLQAYSWTLSNRDSPRAQIYLAEHWRRNNNLMEAEKANSKALALSPNNIAALTQRVRLDCQLNKNTDRSIDIIFTVIAHKNKVSNVDQHHLARMLDFLLGQTCGDASKPENILALLDTLSGSSHGTANNDLQAMLAQRMGIALLQQKKPKEALEIFTYSYHLMPIPVIALNNAALLATYKEYEYVLLYLDSINFHKNSPQAQGIKKLRQLYMENIGYYQREKTHLKKRIAIDALNEG